MKLEQAIDELGELRQHFKLREAELTDYIKAHVPIGEKAVGKVWSVGVERHVSIRLDAAKVRELLGKRVAQCERSVVAVRVVCRKV